MKSNIIHQPFRNLGLKAALGLMIMASTMSCSSKKSEQTDAEKEAAARDTSIMGIQGDTTTNSLDGPISAPSDTVTGQTLPEVDLKKKDN